MATKLGTLSHAKGFVINKLYEQTREPEEAQPHTLHSQRKLFQDREVF